MDVILLTSHQQLVTTHLRTRADTFNRKQTQLWHHNQINCKYSPAKLSKSGCFHYHASCWCWYCLHLCLSRSERKRLTHWGWDKMDAISQTTFAKAFSSMKIYEFRLKLDLSLFLMVRLTIFHHWFRWWLCAGQATSHYLNKWRLDYRRIYASLGLNELNMFVFYQFNTFLQNTSLHCWVNGTVL